MGGGTLSLFGKVNQFFTWKQIINPQFSDPLLDAALIRSSHLHQHFLILAREHDFANY